MLPNLRYVLKGCLQGLHQGGGGGAPTQDSALPWAPALPARCSLHFNGEQEAEAGCSHPQFFPAEPGTLIKGSTLLKTPLSQVVWGELAWLPILRPGIGTGTDRQTHVCAHVMATCRPVGTDMLDAQLWTDPHRASSCRAGQRPPPRGSWLGQQEGQGLGKPRMGPREGFLQERALDMGFGG